MKSRGAFITVEGVDGAGKSTHVDFIADWLGERSTNVVKTREPGGTAVGELLRDIILDHDTPISARAELIMIFAARAQHLDELIIPALDDGRCVLCDRFIDSTYAYQGGGRGIADADIAALERWVQRGLQPDLTVLFDLPAEVGLARADQRGVAPDPDRFEREKIEFRQAVRDAYLTRAERIARIKVIDSNHPIARVRDDLTKTLETFWREREATR
ncbi:MAG: dTMP kinase [bacterium]